MSSSIQTPIPSSTPSAYVVPLEEADRRGGIGSSDVAALVGENPRSSPWRVWAFKRGLIDEPEEIPEYMRWGKLLEPEVGREYARRYGCEAEARFYFNLLFRHSARPWQQAHPDGDRSESRIALEVKTCGFLMAHKYGETGTDQIPEENILQTQWIMSLLDRDVAHVPVLVGGQELRVYEIRRNRDLENFLLETAERFWRKNVLGDDAPAMGAGEAEKDYLRKTFPRNTVELRSVSPAERELVEKYSHVRSLHEDLTENRKALENQIKLAIAEAEGLAEEGLFRITYRRTKDGTSTDWEAVAKEALATLGLIASSKRMISNSSIATAREAVTALVPKYTKEKPGYRRLLPSGPLFKEGKTNGTAEN